MAIIKRITKGSSLTYQEMDDNLEQIAPRTSSTGSLIMPSGATSERDASPANGYLRYNNQLNQFEGYINGGWGGLGGGGGSGEPNQNTFSNFAVSGQTTIAADSTTDTVNFAAGSNISLTTNAITDTLTIAATFSQDFAFSSLTGTPTTVAGYGITDAQALLVSGTNIKTVNNLSLLGSGNITLTASTDWASITNKPNTISGFGIIDAFDGAWSSLTGTPTTVSGYGITDAQEILVSGTNIKTINGVSVLGTGDLTVTGTYGDLQVSAHLNTNSANSSDYLTWNGSDFAWVAGGGGGGSETDPVVGAITGIVKADGGGTISAAVAGSDYSTFDENYSSLQNHPTDLLTAGFSNASLIELVDVVGGVGANGQILTSNGSVFSFQDAPTGGGGGTSTFLGLTDTPSTFSGSGNRVLAVNAGANAIEFIAQAAGAESNDLTQSVTWDIVPDLYISNTSVVQHQTDLLLTLSQITDWDANNFIAAGAEQDPIFAAHTTYNIVNGSGFLRQDGAGNWFYDSNTYITAANSAPETDPIFTAHTTYNIANGTGLLTNNGSGVWSYDTNAYLTANTLNETDPVFQAHTTYNIQNGSGLLAQDGAGNWYYDSNTYLTAAGAETDPIFTAHTTFNITDNVGFLKNNNGIWFYDANTYITLSEIPAETDPVFSGHTVSSIVDGEGFLRQDNANNWYWDSNTYITAADVTSPTVTLDDVLTNGSSTTQNAEFGGLTVGGTAVALETANVATFSNGAGYITLADLSASGDISYNDATGVFSANLQSTGISLNDLSANNASTPSGNGSISYDNTSGVFTYTPPDLSALGGGSETDPTFTASAVANVVASATDGFLRNVGGEWYYDANTYVTAASSETDPVFTAHRTSSIGNGNGLLVNDGADNWSYIATTTYLTAETDPVFSAWTGSSIVDGTGRLQNDGTGIWSYDNTVYVANGQNISDLNNDAGYITGFTETNDLTAAVVWTNIPDAYVPQSAVTQHQAALSIAGSQITDLTYTSNSNITLYKETDGDLTEGSLVFESRDPSPTVGQSMGDIRFYMDTDNNVGTSTLGEYARISANKHSNNYTGGVDVGQIIFGVTNDTTLTPALRIGDTPAGGNPTSTTWATHFQNLPVWMEDSLRVYETVVDTNDITSDADISGLKLTAIDGVGNYKDRVSLSHQNNILRLRVTDRVNDDEYTELIAIPSATQMLSVSYKASGGSTSSYDVWTDYDGAQKVRTELTDENTLHKFGSYANTEYITTSTDFGGFNGGSSGNADLVPSAGQNGSLAFFNWTDALNGTAGANRYIPAGHAEEVVHGMGILRDGGQHPSGAQRWDPFGGPDFRVSVDNTGGSATGLGGLVYMFGGTSISNVDTPVTTIITNQNYNATDATIISQTSYRTGQNTTTFDHEEYARVTVTAVDVTSGTEDAKIVHAVQKAGTLTDMLTVDPDGVTLTDLTVSGKASFNGITTEKTNALTGATGVVTHNLNDGAVFDHTSLAADFTANFTNVPTTNSRTIGVALILSQGGTAYMPTAVQIDGVAQTILWQGGSAPSGTASGTDIVSFTLIRSAAGAWKVIGSATSYS